MKKYIKSRNHYILSKCKGLSVLHIGACDAPLTRVKFESGSLLHTKISEISRTTLGVDIDLDSIEYLKRNGFANIKFLNLTSEIINEKFDVIVFGETIEHLSNIGQMLSAIRQLMTENSELIISTPNAFSLMNFIRAMLDKESIHPDHKVIFSELSLKQLLIGEGFEVTEFYFTTLDKRYRWWRVLLNILVSNLFPRMSDTIILSCKIKNV